MTLIRRLILAAVLIAGISPAIAQVPPPVPALPDTERRTTYSISGSTCACNVNFALYGDSTDVANWLTVWVNGVQVPQSGGWTITSPTGSLATIPRPITDAVLTFTTAQTGTVQIVGARRPRRTSQFSENRGVSARDLNQVITDLTAQNREFWDRQSRTVQAPPGETLSVLSPLAGRASMGACFDSGGNLVSCVGSSAGSFAAGSGIQFTGTNPTTISVLPNLSLVVGSTVLSGGTTLGFLYNNGGVLGNSTFMKQTTNSAGTPTIAFGTGTPTGDDTAVLADRVLAPVSGLLNTHAYRDETAATQAVTGSQFSGYASYDAAPQILGSATTAMNHIRAFQARPVYNSSGHVSEVAGLWSQATVSNAAGTIDAAYGVHIVSPQIIAGGITSQYAFYSDPLSGAINAYFLFGEGVNGSTANPSVLKGNLYVGGRLNQLSVEVANIQFDGTSRQGLLFADTNAVAGSENAEVFFRNNSLVGSIATTLTTTAYNTSSDERLKTFHGNYDFREAERIIRADPVRAFEWKASGEHAIGWGAQTSFAVSPDLASPGDFDLNRKPGSKGFKGWGVDFSKRTPYLWAAMTDVLDRLDAIEQRINHAESSSRPANNAGIHYPRLGPNDGAAKAN